MTTILRLGKLQTVLALALALGSGCRARTTVKDRTPSDAGEVEPTKEPTPETKVPGKEPTPEGGGTTLRLKGTSLLAQSLQRTLGERKDLARDEKKREESVLVSYAANFGTSAGLTIGEIYADGPSTAYLQALGILAVTAADRCAEELDKKLPTSLCRCDTPELARAMLDRAFPEKNWSLPEQARLATSFHEACAKDAKGAISALVGSLGFAKKS